MLTTTTTTTAAASVLLVILLAGQQHQLAHAWWLFSGPAEQAKPETAPPATAATTTVPKAATSGPIKAMAQFDMDTVKGFIKFSQAAPSEPTSVEYDLTGLKGNNKLYHVHVRPVPKFDANQVRNNASALAKLCADPTTGGHLNPHHITEKLPPKSAPLDKYETGDLSGKHGPLVLAQPEAADRYVGSYTDDKLPMSGDNSIIGRSIVIHKNGGARWVCASIERQAY